MEDGVCFGTLKAKKQDTLQQILQDICLLLMHEKMAPLSISPKRVALQTVLFIAGSSFCHLQVRYSIKSYLHISHQQ